MYAIRRRLEPFAVELAARAMTSEALGDIKSLFHQLGKAARRQQLERYIELNTISHGHLRSQRNGSVGAHHSRSLHRGASAHPYCVGRRALFVLRKRTRRSWTGLRLAMLPARPVQWTVISKTRWRELRKSNAGSQRIVATGTSAEDKGGESMDHELIGSFGRRVRFGMVGGGPIPLLGARTFWPCGPMDIANWSPVRCLSSQSCTILSTVANDRSAKGVHRLEGHGGARGRAFRPD